MRLTFTQRLSALGGAVSHRDQIRQLLLRRYWQRKTSWNLNFYGVKAQFATDDFYSNIWFYGSQNIGQAYEPAVTRLVIDYARKARFFADIGANLGYFTVVAASANPTLKVVAIELDEMLEPIVAKNLQRNGLSNVQTKFGAVGDGKSTVVFQPHAYSFLSTAAGEPIAMPPINLKAPSFRLDDFFRGALPDLVKLDVDGAEVVALENAHEMLGNPDLTMFLEVQTVDTAGFPATASACGKILSGYGFSFYRIPDNGPLEPVADLDSLPTSFTTAMVLVTRKPLLK